MLTRLLTKKVHHTFNRDGYYYFSKRVPADLNQHDSYPRIVQGLKRRSAQTTKTRALVDVAKLDEYWSHNRIMATVILLIGYGGLLNRCRRKPMFSR